MLKKGSGFANAITTSFDGFDFVIETFHKAAGNALDKVVENGMPVVVQSYDKAVKGIEALSQKVDNIPKATEMDIDGSLDEEETQAPVMSTLAHEHSPSAPPPTKPPPIRFNKFTFSLREDLHRRLSKTIAHLNLEKDVEVSMAILIRLGIEHVLEQLDHNPDELLAHLYQLEQKEVVLSGDKKYTVNRGLSLYIQRVIRESHNT